MTPRGVQPRRRRHGRLLHRDPGRPPGAGRGPPARAAGAAPLRGAGRGDDRPADDRGRRHPRQDHHHLDDHGDPAARRAGPVVRDRRRDLRGRLQRPPRQRRSTSWPRPTRATGRSCSTGRTSRSSPTSTPTTSTPTATWPGSRTRSSSSAGWSTPDGFVVTCADDPGARRLADAAARRRAGPVYTYGEARRRRPAADRGASRRRTACATWPTLDGEPLGEISAAGARPAPGPQQRGRRADRAAAGPARPRRSPRRWPRSRACGAGSSSRASSAGVRVYDEYAYHPTSMTAALQHAARGGRRRPAARGVPAVPGLPHPRPAGRDRRPRWRIADEAVVHGGLRPRRGARAGRGRGRADRGDRPAAPSTRSSCRPGRTCRPRWSRRARAGRRRGHHGRAADLADGRRAAGGAGRAATAAATSAGTRGAAWPTPARADADGATAEARRAAGGWSGRGTRRRAALGAPVHARGPGAAGCAPRCPGRSAAGVLALVGGAGLGGLRHPGARRARGPGDRHRRAHRRSRCARPPRSPPDTPLARVDLDAVARPGGRRWRRSTGSTVSRDWPRDAAWSR